MYRRFYMDDEVAKRILAHLEQYLSLKIERYKSLLNDDKLRVSAEDGAITSLSKDVDDIKWAINSGETERTENEDLVKIDETIKKLCKQVNSHYYDERPGDRSRTIEGMIEKLSTNASKAEAAFAKLIDDIRIKLLSLEYFVDLIDNGSTHREKSYRCRMLRDALHATGSSLAGIDKDDPRSYMWDWRHSETGSWDYVRALRDLRHAKLDIDEIKKENEELKKKVAELSPDSVEEMPDDEVIF